MTLLDCFDAAAEHGYTHARVHCKWGGGWRALHRWVADLVSQEPTDGWEFTDDLDGAVASNPEGELAQVVEFRYGRAHPRQI